MKRFFLIVLLISIVVFAIYSQTGIIQELTGEVELKQAGALSFSPAMVGSQVARDTIISTGFRSTAIIKVGSNTITVRPLTRLSLAEISSSAEAESLNVNLEAGRIRVEVNPPAGTRANTTVQTPSATASVRGTTFELDTLNIDTEEGNVLYTGNDGLGVLVSGGTSSGLDENGNTKNPVDVANAGLNPSSPVGEGEAGEKLDAYNPSASGNFDFGVDWGDN